MGHVVHYIFLVWRALELSLLMKAKLLKNNACNQNTYNYGIFSSPDLLIVKLVGFWLELTSLKLFYKEIVK